MLDGFLKKLNVEKAFCIYICILCVITYITFVVNISFNADEISRYCESYATSFFTSGRYGRLIIYSILKSIGMETTVPFFSFIILVFSFVIFLVIINDVYDIKGKAKYLLSGVFIVSGSFSEQLQYYTDYIYLAIGLVFVSISLLHFHKYLLLKKFINIELLLSIVHGVFATSVTQYYFILIISLSLILVVKNVFNKNNKNNYHRIEFFKYFLLVVFIIFLYFALLKFINIIANINDNSRINKTIYNLFSFDYICRKIFKSYAIIPALAIKSYASFNISLLTKIAILLIYIITTMAAVRIFTSNKYTICQKCYIALYLFISPLIINSYVFFEETTSIRTTLTLSILFYFFYVLIENGMPVYKKNYQMNSVFCFLLLMIIIPNVYYINGTNYFNYLNNLHQQQFYTEFVSTVKNVDNYSADKRFIFITSKVNNLFDYNNLADYYSSKEKVDLTNKFPACYPFDANLSPHAFIPSINRFGGYKFVEASREEKEVYINEHNVETIPIYPNYGSVFVDGEYIIVRLD